MRGVRIAGAMLVAGLITVTPTPRASADSTTVPGTLNTLTQQTGPLAVTVPPGTVPTAITGVLSMPAVVEGSTVSLLVDGRPAAQIPAALYTKVAIPVLPGDVLDGSLALSMRYDAPLEASSTPTCQPAPQITLRKLGLDYTGTETPPTTVATFFPPHASRIDVKVPPDATDDVLQAAFNPVAALSASYPADTPVELSTADEALATAGAGQRVVTVEGPGADDEAVAMAVSNDYSVPTLRISGSGLPLDEAARTLGTDGAAPAGASDTPTQIPTQDQSPTRTLDQLRAASPALVTSAEGTEQVEIRQDTFATAVSALEVHLEGTHTAVPTGASARLDVYAGDDLVSSTAIGADPALDLDLTIPSSKLRSTTVLRASITSTDGADPTQPCSPVEPLELALDGDASTVTAVAADSGSLRGFQLFPHAFGAQLPVSLRTTRTTGETRIEGAIDAAALVSALQREAAAPLDVTIANPDDFVKQQRSGLFVGADYADSVALDAPLPLAGTRQLSDIEVDTGTAFAALEDVTGLGWSALDDDVMMTDATGTPTTVDSGASPTAVVAAADPTEPASPARSSATALFVAGMVVVLLLLLLRLLLAFRRAGRAVPETSTPLPIAAADADPTGDAPTDPGPLSIFDDDQKDADQDAGQDDDPDEDLDLDPSQVDASLSLSRGRNPQVDLYRHRRT